MTANARPPKFFGGRAFLKGGKAADGGINTQLRARVHTIYCVKKVGKKNMQKRFEIYQKSLKTCLTY